MHLTTHRELLPRLAPVAQAVRIHWTLVNRVLPPERPLNVMADTERDGFVELMALPDTLRTVALEVAAEEILPRDDLRALQERMRLGWKAFRRLLAGEVPDSKWTRMVPPVPPARGQPGEFWDSFHRPLWVWKKMLTSGFDAARFRLGDPAPLPPAQWEAAAADFHTAYILGIERSADTALARGAVEEAEARLAAHLLAYPAAVRSRLPAGHRLLATIPQIWPPSRDKKPPGEAPPPPPSVSAASRAGPRRRAAARRSRARVWG